MFSGTRQLDRVLDSKYWGDRRLRRRQADHEVERRLLERRLQLDGVDRGLVDGVVGGTSLGWLTNQLEGDYFDAEGVEQHYTWFEKIVWVGPGGSLWGQYEIIQQVGNDPAFGLHGLQLKVGAPGFGLNDGWTTS